MNSLNGFQLWKFMKKEACEHILHSNKKLINAIFNRITVQLSHCKGHLQGHLSTSYNVSNVALSIFVFTFWKGLLKSSKDSPSCWCLSCFLNQTNTFYYTVIAVSFLLRDNYDKIDCTFQFISFLHLTTVKNKVPLSVYMILQ